MSLPGEGHAHPIALCGVAAAVALVCSPAVPVHAQIARTEALTIASMTLTDQEFLTGRKNGKPVMLGGVLRLPACTGKVPTAIRLHGSSGISSYVTDWEVDFNALGMATFVIDSFSGRGLMNTNADQIVLGTQLVRRKTLTLSASRGRPTCAGESRRKSTGTGKVHGRMYARGMATG